MEQITLGQIASWAAFVVALCGSAARAEARAAIEAIESKEEKEK